MFDLVGFGEATLRLRAERGRQLGDTDSFAAGVGGPERNALVAASGLGADAVWLSRLPDSPLGDRVVADLRRHGVRTGVSWADADARLATAFVEAGPEPRGRTIVRDADDAAFEGIHAENLPLNAVGNAERFHVAGATVARSEQTAAATESLLAAAVEGDTTTAFDLRYRERDWPPAAARETCESLFPAVDVLFVSSTAAESVLGEEGDPIEIAHALRTKHDLETVVLLRTDGGALAVHGDEVHETDAVRGESIDGAGARDAFVGAFHAKRTADAAATGADAHRNDGAGEPPAGDGSPPGVGDALAWGAAAAALARTLTGESVTVSRAAVERIVAEQ
ncbi:MULTISPECIES: PfkB family carbohydrate kinase [Halolamina]|uniref:2-dehydro-3-deoxygluconokinase n=1 Tax=Halolamina pelagica TaxID=699431 RepID=A0A1I5RIX9_9EURY|nr:MULTISPECIES: PfkB family carbohydrate kinase [Halolamina]NHX35212.1 sugar kinase [Halolamina sp. R1-12]SFP58482.1 2-dehydro-3-deoxygluconokinase [Halolamina pelagica]